MNRKLSLASYSCLSFYKIYELWSMNYTDYRIKKKAYTSILQKHFHFHGVPDTPEDKWYLHVWQQALI
jgi:hypothetical protein